MIPLPALPSLAENGRTDCQSGDDPQSAGHATRKPHSRQHASLLAYWPAYLALSWALTPPLDADGSLDRAIAGVLETARSRAASVAAPLYAPPVDATTRASIRSAVEPFAGDVIARMVVICAVLRSDGSIGGPQTKAGRTALGVAILMIDLAVGRDSDIFRREHRASVDDERRRGCMLVNAALELAPDDPEFQRRTRVSTTASRRSLAAP